ncbi:MAG: EAL domain-containing protein [Rhodospirillales bacterium]|nr:EAL domain-containing protein [Rhodospirillales bacterium]
MPDLPQAPFSQIAPAPEADTYAAAELRALRTLWWAVEQSPAAMMITDAKGRIVYVNPRFSAVTGYGRLDVLGRNPRFLVSTAADAGSHGNLWGALRAGEDWRGIVCNRRADGTDYEAEAAISPVRDANGAITHFVTVYNGTAATPPHDSLPPQSGPLPPQAGAPFQELIESAAYGVLVVGNEAPVYANRAVASIFGYAQVEDILSLPSLDDLFAEDERDRIKRYRRARANGLFAPKAFECRGVRKDGTIIWLDVRVRLVMWDGVASTCWTVSDITLRRIYEDRLQQQANFDPVTDLPNRSLALDRLSAAIATSRRRFRKVGVLFIDIDGFKSINDTFGHSMGDRFLRHIGELIKTCVREEDTVARLGGDEFTAILPDLRSGADAESVGRKIIEAVSAPFRLDGREAFVGASIGITISAEDGSEAETLLRNADSAMYQAKTSGRNTLRFFTPELNARAINRNRAAARLRLAIEREELRVMYQPIVHLGTGKVLGAEALLRWRDPEIGLVDAEHFVHVAEETGLIVPIGTWIVATACRDAASWRRPGNEAPYVSINVCSREFRGSALTDAVMNGLRDNNLPAESLHLEFAESLLMIELPQIVTSVRKLASAGVRLSVDDFGSGLSSLNSLSKYPLTTIKIESSLTRRMTATPAQTSLVEAIIAVAHRLDISVVAEGVETTRQLSLLRRRACDAAQGYVFSEPLSAEGLADLLATWSDRCPAGFGES